MHGAGAGMFTPLHSSPSIQEDEFMTKYHRPDEGSIRGLDGYDTVIATGSGNLVFGTHGSESLSASIGNDFVFAYAGDDTVLAGEGGDLVIGAEGSDVIDLGEGNDLVFSGSASDTVTGGIGEDTIFANQGADLVVGGEGNDTAFGGQGGDTLSGDAGLDVLFGNLGNDTVDGGDSDDWLHGGQGADVLIGASGNDTLDGGVGADTLSGGVGGDMFVQVNTGGGSDVVADFHADEGDQIALSAEKFDADDVSAALSLAHETSTGLEISLDGHKLMLAGMTAAEVQASSFVFI
jgi:Ca2+-binding RTX toxin-like protein